MLKSFLNNEIQELNIEYNKLKYPIPALVVNHKKDNKNCFIFLNGLNGTKWMIKYFKNDLFNNATLITFDGRDQGENKNKGSQLPYKYVSDIHFFIKKIKSLNQFKNIKNWYLMGESWGSALAILFYSKYKNENIINKYFIWNMPLTIFNSSNLTKKEEAVAGIKTVGTLLFNINTKLKNKINEKLINDETILRAFSLYSKKYIFVRPSIAAWRSCKKAWKFFTKNVTDCIYYFQTKNDICCDYEKLKKIMSIKTNIYLSNNGSHIASLDKNVQGELFSWIKNLIN